MIAGEKALRGLEIPHGFQTPLIAPLASPQVRPKQGRRCNYTTWSLVDLWVAFFIGCRQQDLPCQSFLKHSGYVADHRRWDLPIRKTCGSILRVLQISQLRTLSQSVTP